MSVNKDVTVKLRFNVEIVDLKDENDPSGRGGRQGSSQKRYNLDVAVINTDMTEFNRRLADAYDVLYKGYELEGTEPPEAFTEEATVVTATTAILNGRVYPNTNTSCGFLYGLTKELDNTTNADQSPIAASSDIATQITASLAGLTANTRYYFRAWSQIAGVEVRYGRIRSFKTLAV